MKRITWNTSRLSAWPGLIWRPPGDRSFVWVLIILDKHWGRERSNRIVRRFLQKMQSGDFKGKYLDFSDTQRKSINQSIVCQFHQNEKKEESLSFGTLRWERDSSDDDNSSRCLIHHTSDQMIQIRHRVENNLPAVIFWSLSTLSRYRRS